MKWEDDRHTRGDEKELPGGLSIRRDEGRVILTVKPTLKTVSLDAGAARALADELKKQAILLENAED